MPDDRNEFCPYEPEARAAHCTTCLDAMAGLPPCVAAWLDQEAVAVIATERRRPRLPLRRAA
jgi:hypothetical protein